MTPFGVGESAPPTQPFGAFSKEPFGAPTTPIAQADPDLTIPVGVDPSATMAVPQQRSQHVPAAAPTSPGGTVYGTGGYPSIDMTMPVSTNPVENSGSLTGHILAQGWHDEIVDRRRSNLKVAIVMLVVLGILVTVSVVFLLTAGSALSDMMGGLFS